MYSYKIVAVLVFQLSLLLFKRLHVYCLWPPHYYTLGVHVYCLWPLLFVCPFTINRNFSARCTTQEECHCRRNHYDWRRPPNDCLSLEAGTNFIKFFFTMLLSYIVGYSRIYRSIYFHSVLTHSPKTIPFLGYYINIQTLAFSFPICSIKTTCNSGFLQI